MKDQPCGFALGVRLERDLCVYDFQEIIARAFRENLKFRLSGGFNE
jgi:hypothetical protein